MTNNTPQAARPDGGARGIVRLNDQLRARMSLPGYNRVVMTTGIAALIGDVALSRDFRRRAQLLRTLRDFDRSGPGNDPYGEHDMDALRSKERTACGRSTITTPISPQARRGRAIRPGRCGYSPSPVLTR